VVVVAEIVVAEIEGVLDELLHPANPRAAAVSATTDQLRRRNMGLNPFRGGRTARAHGFARQTVVGPGPGEVALSDRHRDHDGAYSHRPNMSTHTFVPPPLCMEILPCIRAARIRSIRVSAACGQPTAAALFLKGTVIG
jgi:hypothetical protein